MSTKARKVNLRIDEEFLRWYRASFPGQSLNWLVNQLTHNFRMAHDDGLQLLPAVDRAVQDTKDEIL